MESTQEPMVQLKHNHSNILDKLHRMLIQRKHAGVERLLCNQKRHIVMAHTK
jgi:hypothetical protein